MRKRALIGLLLVACTAGIIGFVLAQRYAHTSTATSTGKAPRLVCYSVKKSPTVPDVDRGRIYMAVQARVPNPPAGAISFITLASYNSATATGAITYNDNHTRYNFTVEKVGGSKQEPEWRIRAFDTCRAPI